MIPAKRLGKLWAHRERTRSHLVGEWCRRSEALGEMRGVGEKIESLALQRATIPAPLATDLQVRIDALIGRGQVAGQATPTVAPREVARSKTSTDRFFDSEASSATLRSLVTDVRGTRALLKSLLESVVADSDQLKRFYQTSLLAEGAKRRVVHGRKNWLGD